MRQPAKRIVIRLYFPVFLIQAFTPLIPMYAQTRVVPPKMAEQVHKILPWIMNLKTTERAAIMVMYWLVLLMTCGNMLYLRKSGPRTMPPAIPVQLQRMATKKQKKLSLATSKVESNRWSYASYLQPQASLSSCIFLTLLTIIMVMINIATKNTPKLKYLAQFGKSDLLPLEPNKL